MRYLLPILVVLFLVSAADAHGRSQSSRFRFRSQQNIQHHQQRQPSQVELEAAFRAGQRSQQQQDFHGRQQFNGRSQFNGYGQQFNGHGQPQFRSRGFFFGVN